MLIKYANNQSTQTYKLMSQTIIPRPIAWVVTEDEGVINIAPFSYFNALSSNPPTMVISVGHKSDGSPKDTLHNLRKNKKCTICMVKPEYFEMMHFSSKEAPSNVSEADLFDIPLTNTNNGYPPMVTDTPIAFFCDLYSEIDLGESKTIPMIVEIKEQFIDDSVIVDEEKLSTDVDLLARIGKSYVKLGEKIVPPDMPK